MYCFDNANDHIEQMVLLAVMVMTFLCYKAADQSNYASVLVALV